MSIMIYDKVELSAMQLILWFDAFLVYALEVADRNGGQIDSTVVARDFAVKKIREMREKEKSSNVVLNGNALLTEHDEEGGVQ